MAIYSQDGYYLSYNTGKKLFYHVEGVRHYFLPSNKNQTIYCNLGLMRQTDYKQTEI